MNELRRAFLMDSLAAGEEGAEKRSRKRASVIRDVLVTALDDEMRAIGNPIRARTRDLSTTGVGFLHVTPFKSKHMIMTITMPSGDDLDLLFKVVRTRSVSDGRHFTAGEFVERLNHAD